MFCLIFDFLPARSFCCASISGVRPAPRGTNYRVSRNPRVQWSALTFLSSLSPIPRVWLRRGKRGHALEVTTCEPTSNRKIWIGIRLKVRIKIAHQKSTPQKPSWFFIGMLAAFPNGVSVVLSNGISLVSGLFRRIVTRPVDLYWNSPMDCQWYFRWNFTFMISVVICLLCL